MFKSSNQKLLKNIFVGISMILSLMFLHLFEHKLFPPQSETAHKLSQLLQAFLILGFCFSLSKAILFGCFLPLETKNKIKIPAIAKDIVYAIIFCVGAIIIIQNVYGESVFGMISLLAGSGVVVGIAAKGILEEIITGFVMDFQDDLRAGEWIRFQDGKIAKIAKTKLTGIDLITTNGSKFSVSNTYFKNQPIIRFEPKNSYFSVLIKVTLENVKLSTDEIKKIFEKDSYKSILEGAKCGRISFNIRIEISNSENWKQVRDREISNILKILRQENLSVFSISGEHRFSEFNI